MYTLSVAVKKHLERYQGEIAGAIVAILFFLGYGLISYGAPEASSRPPLPDTRTETISLDFQESRRFVDVFGYEDTSVEYINPNSYGNDLDVTVLLEGGIIEKLRWNKVVAEAVETDHVRFLVLSAVNLGSASEWQPYIDQFTTLFEAEKQESYRWTMDAILAHLRQQKMPQGLYAAPKTSGVKPILVLALEEGPTLNFSVQWVLEFDRETANSEIS